MAFKPTPAQLIRLEQFPFLSHLEGEDPDGFIGLGPASRILGQLAELGKSGNYPHNIPLEAVGAALYRICINADVQEVGLSNIVLGWQAAHAYHFDQ